MLEKLIKRLLRLRIITITGCWETKLKSSQEHVRIGINGKNYFIHRVSAAYYLGLNLEDPKQLALHKNECHNPKCWNPDHLYIGNKSNNSRDWNQIAEESFGQRIRRLQKLKTHCPNGHSHTKKGRCPECEKARKRKYNRKIMNSKPENFKFE